MTGRTYLSLELLRGIFSFWVVAWHFFARIDHKFIRELADPKGETPSTFLMYSYDILFWGSDVAVIGFFILSGFVTSINFSQLLDRHAPRKPFAVLSFYAARLVRIWPITILTVLASVPLAYAYRVQYGDLSAWGRYDDFSPVTIAWNALGLSSHWNAPAWTLVYELTFYAISPFLLLFLIERNHLVKLLCGTIFILYIALFARVYASLQMFITFGLGVGLYFIFERTNLVKKIGEHVNYPAIAVASLVYLLALMKWNAANGLHFTTATFLIVALFLWASAGSEEAVTKLKERPVIRGLRGLAACSYSLYLWHWSVFWFTSAFFCGGITVNTGPEILKLFLVSVPVLGAITWTSWYFVERNAKLSKLRVRYMYAKPQAEVATGRGSQPAASPR